MAASEMDDIRDIPGYKIILRAVLKSQIQHLVETLASQTDEESVIITASLSEGTSTHLGSESGKNFLQDHENVKTQFLGFCLKKLYKKHQEKEKEQKLKKKTFSQEQQSREANSFSSPKERVHTVRLTKASPVSRPSTVRHKPYTKPATSRSSGKSSPGVHHEPYPIPQTHRSVNQTSPSTSQTSTSSPVTTHIKIEPLDFNLDQGDDEINKSVTSEPASPSSASVDPASTDNLVENCDISVNNHTSNLPSDTKTQSLDSSFTNLKSSELSVNPSTSSVQSSDVDRNVAVKIEAISECDMNLEITEVTSCQDTSSCQDIPNIGFNPSGTAENQTDIQGGKGNTADILQSIEEDDIHGIDAARTTEDTNGNEEAVVEEDVIDDDESMEDPSDNENPSDIEGMEVDDSGSVASSDDLNYADYDDSVNDPDYKSESDNESTDLDDYEEEIAFQKYVGQIAMGDKEVVENQTLVAENQPSNAENQPSTDENQLSIAKNQTKNQPSSSAVKGTHGTTAIVEVNEECLVLGSDQPFQRSVLVPEKNKVRDKKYPGIYIKRLYPSNDGKLVIKKFNRPYDTVHACKFCCGLFTHIQAHLENKHKDEPQVLKLYELKQKVNNQPDEDQQKLIKRYQCLLRYEGDHLHNMKVIQNKHGELLVQRKACVKKNFVHHKFGPCPKCFVWLHLESSLQGHRSHCVALDSTSIGVVGQKKTRLTKAVSKAIVGKDLEIHESCPLVKRYIMPTMHNDKIGKLAKNDRLICELGEIWMVKTYGNKTIRNKTSSFRMRLCARLLAAVRALTNKPNLRVSDILCPDYFRHIVKVAINLCEKDNKGKLKHPTVAMKLGYDLGRLAGLKLKTCRKEQDRNGEFSTMQFLKMLESQWSIKVFEFSHPLGIEEHIDNQQELPQPEDIATIAENLVRLTKELKLSEAGQYHKVVQVVLPRLMLYNCTRSWDIEALHIANYRKRSIELDEVESSFLSGDLTMLGKYIVETQQVMWIKTKDDKQVPVLIPPDLKEPLAYIVDVKNRATAGVNLDNPYIFANKGKEVYSALQCLQTLCSENNLIHEDNLTSTGFRTYMATIVQCIRLRDHDVQWLCEDLGHTLTEHSYCKDLMEGIDRCQLAKLIMIHHTNMVEEYRAKGLQGIQYADIIKTLDEEAEHVGPASEEEPNVHNDSIQTNDKEIQTETIERPEPVEKQNTMNEDRVDSEESTKSVTEQVDDEESTKPVRQRWTEDEVAEIKRLFHSNIEKLKCPNKKDLTEAKIISENENGVIHLRKLDTIKKKVSNMIIKIKQNK